MSFDPFEQLQQINPFDEDEDEQVDPFKALSGFSGGSGDLSRQSQPDVFAAPEPEPLGPAPALPEPEPVQQQQSEPLSKLPELPEGDGEEKWLDTLMGIFDNDLLDLSAQSLAGMTSGFTRLIAETLDSDYLRDASESFAADAKEIDSKLNEATLAKRQKQAEAMAELREKDAGFLAEFVQGLKGFADAPLNTLAQLFGSSVPSVVTGLLTGPVGGAVVFGTVGGASAAGDAAGSAYDGVMALSDQVFESDPNYQALVEDQGMTPLEARERMAGEAAKLAGAVAFPIGVVTGTLGRKVGLESLIVGKTDNLALRAGAEGLTEAAEEVATTGAGNIGIGSVDPDQSLTEGFGESAALGLAGGSAMAAGIGGAERLRPNRNAQPPQQTQTGETNGEGEGEGGLGGRNAQSEDSTGLEVDRIVGGPDFGSADPVATQGGTTAGPGNLGGPTPSVDASPAAAGNLGNGAPQQTGAAAFQEGGTAQGTVSLEDYNPYGSFAPEYQDALREGDWVTPLQAVIDGTPDPDERAFAQSLMTRLSADLRPINLEVVKADSIPMSNTGSNAATAAGDVVGRNIRLDERAGTNPEILIHELAHVLTIEALNSAQGSLDAEPNEAFDKFNQAMVDTYAAYEEGNLDSAAFYGMTNEREFAAELYANPKFRAELKQIKTSKKENAPTLWQKAINAIAEFFGVDFRVAERAVDVDSTVFADATRALEDIIATTSGDTTTNRQAGSDLTSAVLNAPADPTPTWKVGERHRVRFTKKDGSVRDMEGVVTEVNTGGRDPHTKFSVDGPDGPVTRTVTHSRLQNVDGVQVAPAAPNAPRKRKQSSEEQTADRIQNAITAASRADTKILEGLASVEGITPHELIARLTRKVQAEPHMRSEMLEQFTNKKVRATLDRALDRSVEKVSREQEKPPSRFGKKTPRPAGTFSEWTDELRGLPPDYTGNVPDYWVREQIVDSGAPFMSFLQRLTPDWTGDIQNHPLWQKFKLFQSKAEVLKGEMTEQQDALDKQFLKFAKAAGVPIADFVRTVDSFLRARYVAAGANEDQVQRNRETITRLHDEMVALERGDPQKMTLAMRINELQKWNETYQQIANETADELTEESLLGGLTRAQAQEGLQIMRDVNGVDVMAQVESAADAVLGMRNAWVDKAIEGGVFKPDELDSIPGRRAGASEQFYVPTKEQRTEPIRAMYGIGGVAALDRDMQRVQDAIGSGGMEAVMGEIGSYARRIPFTEFTSALFQAGDTGQRSLVRVVPSGAPTGENTSFSHKVYDPDTNETTEYKLVLQTEAGQKAANAIIGSNRREVKTSVGRGLQAFTQYRGFLVTQATLAYGPINMWKDWAERTYSLLAKNTDIPIGKFTALSLRHFADPTNLLASFAIAFDTDRPFGINMENSVALREAKELKGRGGLTTKSGGLRRERTEIARAIAQQTGFKGSLKSIVNGISKWNEAFEINASLAVWRALRGSTDLDLDTAAFRILDVMNFIQSGSFSPVMRGGYMFFNAQSAGARNMLEVNKHMLTFTGSNKALGTRQRAMAMMSLGGAGILYALSTVIAGEDEETGFRGDNLFGIERNMPLYLPGLDGNPLKIPMPFGPQNVHWNTIVALGRLGTGKYNESQAAAHIMQSAIEQGMPMPVPAVSVTQNPLFWATKTVLPHYFGPIVNAGTGINDFGHLGQNPFPRRDRPNYMQGLKRTDEGWSAIAKLAHDLTGGQVNMLPEQFRELSQLVFMGPMDALFKTVVEDPDPDKPVVHGQFTRFLGLNRLYWHDNKQHIRAFYDAEADVNKLTSRAFQNNTAPKPDRRSKKGKQQYIQWLANGGLTRAEIVKVHNYMQIASTRRRLKRAKEAESIGTKDFYDREERLIRNFLRINNEERDR